MIYALLAIKCIKQPFNPSQDLLSLMETFRRMVNDCIKIGLENNSYTLKHLTRFTYKHLSNYNIITYYKLCAISHAAGILANRKKSLKRGLTPRQPYAKRLLLISCYGFKIEDGTLKIPIGAAQYLDVPLNNYVRHVLSDPKLQVRSFTLTYDTLSIAISKEVAATDCTEIMGIDRNLRNVTAGNQDHVVQYDLSKTVSIVENTYSIMRSFKRNDVRIRKKLYAKYGKRRKNRVIHMLHAVSKAIVKKSKDDNSAIAFEDIRRIRKLYQRGNGQGNRYRGMMNSWSFAEIKRQIEYKARWEGVHVIHLTVKETRGTSQLCPQCGKKITQVDRRQLWCAECMKWMDRDVVAAINLSIKGLARFVSPKGLAGEAMRGNVEKEPLILRVDASKLNFRYLPNV